VAATLGADLPVHSAASLSANPARLAFDEPPNGGRRWKVPTGVVDLIFDRPTVEPQDPDFDWIEAVGLTLRHPTVFSRGGDDAPRIGFGGPEGTLPLARFNPDGLDRFLPPDGADYGHARVRVTLDRIWPLGPRWGTLRLILLQYERRTYLTLSPDDRLRAWTKGAPVVDGQTASLSVDTWTGADFSSGIGWAKEFRLFTPAPDPDADWRDAYWDREANAVRLALGTNLRRSTGLVFQRYHGRLDFTAMGTELQARPQMRRAVSRLGWFENLSGTWAVDLGAALRWRELEIGMGISDLLTRWRWNESRVDLYQTSASGDEVTRQRENSSARIAETGPGSRWRLDARYVWAATRFLAVAEGGLGGTDVTLASTHALGDAFLVRGGVQRDRRHLWQVGAGLQYQRRRYGVEVGARTDSYDLSGRREIAFSLALVRN
jgi:hypothetical protein